MIFENKIKKCLQIAEYGLSVMDKPYHACSWGKDSVLTLWILLQLDKNIQVVYLNSHYAFPDNYELRDYLLKKWQIINYYEIQPEIDSWDLVKESGLGDITMDISQMKKRVGGKKAIFDKYAYENDFDGNFWGLRADESKGRRHLFRAKTPTFFDNTKLLWRCAPIAWIQNSEIFDILNEYNIPYSKIYDKQKLIKREQIRNSSWLATKGASKGRIGWLRYYYPELYQKLIEEFPEVKSYV